jgi:hypothetical protein
MKGVIFHNLKNANLTNNIKVDVSDIISCQYSKRMFKILDKKNDYQLHIEYYNPMKKQLFIGDFVETKQIYLPTARRCINEINEIKFKQDALKKYVNKLQNEIIPIKYEDFWPVKVGHDHHNLSS